MDRRKFLSISAGAAACLLAVPRLASSESRWHLSNVYRIRKITEAPYYCHFHADYFHPEGNSHLIENLSHEDPHSTWRFREIWTAENDAVLRQAFLRDRVHQPRVLGDAGATLSMYTHPDHRKILASNMYVPDIKGIPMPRFLAYIVAPGDYSKRTDSRLTLVDLPAHATLFNSRMVGLRRGVPLLHEVELHADDLNNPRSFDRKFFDKHSGFKWEDIRVKYLTGDI